MGRAKLDPRLQAIKGLHVDMNPSVIHVESGAYMVPGWYPVPRGTTLGQIQGLVVWQPHQPTGKQQSAYWTESVISSDGVTVYEVRGGAGTWPVCGCLGYQYRRKCRHIDIAMARRGV